MKPGAHPLTVRLKWLVLVLSLLRFFWCVAVWWRLGGFLELYVHMFETLALGHNEIFLLPFRHISAPEQLIFGNCVPTPP